MPSVDLTVDDGDGRLFVASSGERDVMDTVPAAVASAVLLPAT
jgi:hypothetical protein